MKNKKEQFSLKSLRTNANLTQDGLAQILGVNVKTISVWEKGENIKPLYLYAIAYVLKIDVDIIRI